MTLEYDEVKNQINLRRHHISIPELATIFDNPFTAPTMDVPYGYLTGSYVRDKDAVNAAFMICEMFAFYKTQNISLIEKLNELYCLYGYCLNTLHSYEFPESAGMEKMGAIMCSFHEGLKTVGGRSIVKIEDYSVGLNGLPKSDVLKFFFEGDVSGSVVIRPSGTELKLKAYISVTAENKVDAEEVERQITADLEKRL